MLKEKVLESLELNKVLLRVKAFLCLDKSAEVLFAEKPAESFDNMKARLSLTGEADIAISHYNIDPISSYDDESGVLLKAEKKITLTVAEILKIQRLLRSSRLFKTKINSINEDSVKTLKEYASFIYVDKNFEDECDRCFISDEQISDNASSALYSIRNNIRKTNEEIKEKLNFILRSASASKYVQDFYVTVRNGRYVIPIKAEFKNNVNGMLHDQSSTGATVYIEPEAVVQLNNELKILHLKENEEIEKILQQFTVSVSTVCDSLRLNSQTMVKADIAFAKARYAHSVKGIYPIINSNGNINIINGRHPLIDKNIIIPVSLKLGKDYKYLIITGPNTGGKTVTLKLCGLFTVMAMHGMFLPASDGTEISFFSNIFTDIGDEQSIEHNLSTFSSHMKNIIDICESVDFNTLVLIDEIGAGTDPTEGAALALAVLEHLLSNGSKGIITTHYSELKEYAFLNSEAINASMEFDPVNLKPSYKLKIGIPGSSNALEISKKLGLSEDIVSAAYRNLSGDKISFEKVLKYAEEARKEAELNLDESEKIKKELQIKAKEIEEEENRIKALKDSAILAAKSDAKKIYADAVGESEELLDELKNIIKSEEIHEYDLNRSRQIKKQLENKKYEFSVPSINNDIVDLKPVTDLKIGQTVYIKSLAKLCKVISISKNGEDVTVNSENIIIKTNKKDLFIPTEERKTPTNKSRVSIVKNIKPVSATTEIKLLGKTILEALPEIDEFLDNCCISGIKECKIIHGMGTGVLRKAIREYLKSQPLVESYRSGKYGEGEDGVTVVTLK